MKSLWFEIPVQLAFIAVLGAVVYRDAAGRRKRLGAAPGGVSPQTCAGICALLWIPAVYYFAQRKQQDSGAMHAGASVKHIWWAIALGIAVVWLGGDLQAGRTSGIVEHALYLGLVLAGRGWAAATSADDAGTVTQPAG